MVESGFQICGRGLGQHPAKVFRVVGRESIASAIPES